MTQTKMPEPVAWMLAYQTMGGDVGWKLSWTQSGAGVCYRLSGESHEKPLITTTQAEAYAAAKVREALEEAAQACEARIGQHSPGMTPEDVEDCDEEARLCAAAVRALIPPLPGPVEPTT